MEIKRTGAGRDHGESFTKPKVKTVSFHQPSAQLLLTCGTSRDFVTSSTHSYRVYLSIPEIVQIIDGLAGAAMADPSRFSNELGGALKSLVQLQAVAGGLVTKPDNEI